MRIKTNLVLSILFFSTFSFASVQSKEFSISDKLPKAIDFSKVKKPSSLGVMAQIRWYQKKSKWKICVSKLSGVSHASDISLWVGVNHLKCLKNWYKTDSKAKVSTLLSAFSKIEQTKTKILSSHYEEYRVLMQEVFLDVAEIALNKSRSSLSEFVGRNHDLVDLMDNERRAKYYRIVGELSWLYQKTDLATKNFLRSYDFKSSSEVLARLKSLKADNLLHLNKYSEAERFSDAENKLWGKFQKAVHSSRSMGVVHSGVELINKYPGSSRVKKVDEKISRFFKRILYRRGKKYDSVKKDFRSIMKKAPPAFVSRWADTAYQRGYYTASLDLSSQAVDRYGRSDKAAEALIIASRSSYYLNQRSESRGYLEKLTEQFAGNEKAFEAQYLLGLLCFREEAYKKVIHIYEKFLLSSGSDLWELQVRYWLWRALKQTKNVRAKEQEDYILKHFPLTYYGLLILNETTGKMQGLFREEMKKVSTQYWWTVYSSRRWKQVYKLVSFGWIEEAEREMDQLPSPQTGEDFLLRARFWESIGSFRRAIMDYSASVDRSHRFITKKFMKSAFPKKYGEGVKKASDRFKLSQELILSVIRQESAFSPNAVSPSRAMGLMQLLKPTAKETATWLKEKKYRPNDIFEPNTNIRFGTHFLSRMLRKYKGVVPLAVASYNVGPGNLDRWLKQRRDLDGWAQFGKKPIDDLWVDELPWAETSFYVKAILRNYLLYGLIYGSDESLKAPAWSGAQSLVPAAVTQ